MSLRKIEFAPYEFYHVYNRGADKRPIFQDTADNQRFVELLYISNGVKKVMLGNLRKVSKTIFDADRGDPLVAIGAYCLMPNHFHILLAPVADDGVTRFMQKLCTGYSMYFNKRYERTGTLFEGKFKAQWASEDRYLKYLYSYIHLNPLKLHVQDSGEGVRTKSTLEYLCEYPFSSLPDYLGVDRAQTPILNPEFFPEYFQTSAEHINELTEWLGYKSEQTEEVKEYR